MKTSSKIGLLAALLLFLVGGLLLLGRGTPLTPDQLIVQTLKDAEDSAKRGSANGVIDTVSQDFRAGGWNRAKLKLLLIRSMAQGRGTDYDVHVNQPLIKPNKGHDDERLVFTRFAAFSPGSGEDFYKTNEPVILVMRQETRAKWVVFQEPYWRVVGVANLPALPGNGTAGEFGGVL